MFRRGYGVALVAFLMGGGIPLIAQERPSDSRRPAIRVIGQTTLVGHSDPVVWKFVLDLLPVRPRRIELLDLDSLSAAARQKLRGLEAFVLDGHTTIVVLRQSATLRLAEKGDGLDRLALASLIWHELAHVNGLDERGALEQEQALWRRFIGMGLVNGAVGMSCIARLQEASARIPSSIDRQ